MKYLIIAMLFFNGLCWADDDTNDLFNYSKKEQEALVVKVVDSDLIVLENGTHVKLIGIESAGPIPHKEVKYDKQGRVIDEPEEPTISLQEQALDFARNLLENKKVKLEYDVDAEVDGYLNAYVYLPDGRMANAELLRMGFVKLRVVPPNVKHEDELDKAYQEAKQEKRGLEDE